LLALSQAGADRLTLLERVGQPRNGSFEPDQFALHRFAVGDAGGSLLPPDHGLLHAQVHDLVEVFVEHDARTVARHRLRDSLPNVDRTNYPRSAAATMHQFRS